MPVKKRLKKKGKKGPKKSPKKVKEVDSTKLDVEKFEKDQQNYVANKENQENYEKWKKQYFEEVEILDMKREVEEIREDFQRISAIKHAKCVEEIEKLNTRDALDLTTIGKIQKLFEKTMQHLKEVYLKDREDILGDLAKIIEIPVLKGPLESAVAEFSAEISTQNGNHTKKLVRKSTQITEEFHTFLENMKESAEETKNCLQTVISRFQSCYEESENRQKMLSFIADCEKKMIDLKNIINSRRKKDFFYVILQQHFKKIQKDTEKKLTIFRDRKSSLRTRVNFTRDLLAKESSREKKSLEQLTLISTEEIQYLEKIFSHGKKLSKILHNILKIDKNFIKKCPEKSSLASKLSEIQADVIMMKKFRSDLQLEKAELCELLKNYCNNKIIDK